MGIRIYQEINSLMKILFFSSLLISLSLSAQTRLDLAVIDEYLKIQSDYVKEVCTSGTEVKYLELLKDYQGDGNYIPTLLDEKIDLKTIKSVMPILDEKISWLSSLNEKLKTTEDFKESKIIISEIHKIAIELQNLKRDYYEKNSTKQNEILIASKSAFDRLLIKIEQLKTSTPFLLSFRFPVNHLELRSEYEKIKESKDKEGRSRANVLFFTRKIIQDGSYDEENLRSDAMIRAAFDTLYLSVKKNQREGTSYFLSDAERVDLKFVLRNFDILLRNNPSKILKRSSEWEKRIVRAKDFYNNLLINKNLHISENSQLVEVTNILENRSKSLYNLKDFSLSNQAKSYEFWSKKSELFQSLFALESILYSEVGRSDENVGFFRKDVAQVVLNRVMDPNFNQLGVNDSIKKYLNKDIITTKNPWLNVIFKEGEFSFTYFYIPGNLQIFCPDMSRVGRFLRKENLKIGMNAIKNPRLEFKGIRYFSRVSMFGRINMDSIWKDYTPISEEPGADVIHSVKKLKSHYLNGHYRYLYEFYGADKSTFNVIEIQGTQYVINKDNPEKFYTYRNPHLFKFFSYLK